MQVVLLAAGMGLRLGHLTRALPKAMIKVNSRVLIDYTLPRLLENRRVEEVIVVGGFEYNSLKSHVLKKYQAFGERLRVVNNLRFIDGNLYSLHAALPYLESSTLLCNVDHIYSELTWRRILQERECLSIFCDFLRPLGSDDMKVELNVHKHLVTMSKQLAEYDGGYVGLTYIPAQFLETYKEAAHRTAESFGKKAVVENVLPLMAADGYEFSVEPFDKEIWFEIDTQEDLLRAESVLYQKQPSQMDSSPA